MKLKKQTIAELSILFITAVWGLSFVIIKDGTTEINPYYYNFIRFSLAGLLLLGCSYQKWSLINAEVIKKGFFVGLALSGGYIFQAIGIKYTTASNAAFITNLAIVFVPLLLILIERHFPGPITVLGVIFSTIGLALLSLQENFSIQYGDLLVLICAICYSIHLILVNRYTKSFDTLIFTTFQILTVAVVSGLIGLGQEPVTLASLSALSADFWLGVAILALFGTAVAFFVQTWAQKFASLTRVTLLLALEPIFALVFAYLFLGEVFTLKEFIGTGMMLGGILLIELKGA
ncbi:DMT family transporter [Bacillota bacterium LX-D]|nr:DMT family transporter [Bacillota bacterium LX-D]